MKKKNYVAPQMECRLMEDTTPLCSSPSGGSKVQGSKSGTDFWNDDFDLNYGGVDDGNLDPS